MIQLIPVIPFPIVNTEDEIWSSLQNSLKDLLEDGDILVSAHTPWSRVKGYIYDISEVQPSARAIEIASIIDKPAAKIEVILQSSLNIEKIERNLIIATNKAGILCANAGIDESNAGIGKLIAVPEDPDNLALEIRNFVKEQLHKDIAVIISDTVGRALRRGVVNIAIGISGIPCIRSDIEKKDLFGYEMKVSQVAIADEIASAAELLQGQSDEGVPFVIVRGFKINFEGEQSARFLNRPKEERLFR
ncbi:MAG: coenzyme F420-0:L-glutamate ligase [Candidatus Heimdallarchaeota archaeon]|nr:coenzyme F420-0:L-glutamate ligase [Candidatus Heimdallarchaeota archaeon]MDH5645031.1 coenzyme F420-0:L-glutamate ligase [Candidatus Heimdallarchaeota archaeon]